MFNHIMEILLNGITFRLIGKLRAGQYGENNILYNIIHIQSSINDQNFNIMSYASNSEVGLWRFAVRHENKYYKSFDYVQSTLIHLDLQRFIISNYDNIPDINIDHYISIGLITRCSINRFYLDANSDITKDALNKNTRPAMNYNACPFHILKGDSYIECGNNAQDTIKYLNDVSTILSKAYTIGNEQVIIDNYVNYFVQKYRIEGQIMSVDMNLHNDLKMYLSQPFNDFIKNNNIPKCIYYDQFVLYYLRCTVTGIDGINPNEIQYMPILLTTRENKINKLGLNTMYMDAGAYICKLFDYTQQCHPEEGAIVCSETYSFIGKRYNGIFPFPYLSGAIVKEPHKENIQEPITIFSKMEEAIEPVKQNTTRSKKNIQEPITIFSKMEEAIEPVKKNTTRSKKNIQEPIVDNIQEPMPNQQKELIHDKKSLLNTIRRSSRKKQTIPNKQHTEQVLPRRSKRKVEEVKLSGGFKRIKGIKTKKRKTKK